MGELNAIREITEEKQMYDAREKASLDSQSNLIDAEQEGIEIGEQRGEQRGIEIGEQRGKLKGSVQIYEGLLGSSASSDDVLSKKSASSRPYVVDLFAAHYICGAEVKNGGNGSLSLAAQRFR